MTHSIGIALGTGAVLVPVLVVQVMETAWLLDAAVIVVWVPSGQPPKNLWRRALLSDKRQSGWLLSTKHRRQSPSVIFSPRLPAVTHQTSCSESCLAEGAACSQEEGWGANERP